MAESITSAYVGESAGKYIQAALLTNETILNGGITVVPNVKYKETMTVISSGALTTDASCDFSDGGTITTTEVVLEPKHLQVGLDVCKQTLISSWAAREMGFSAHDNTPSNFVDYTIAQISDKVAQENEVNFWQGDAGNSGEYDGILTLAAADATVVDVAGVAGGITDANVQTEMRKAIDEVPQAVYRKADKTMFVAPDVFRSYIRSLGGDGTAINGYENKGAAWYQNGGITFEGFRVFLADGMPDGYMVVTYASNLYFATGLLADHNEVKLIDRSETEGDNNLRFIMKFSGTAAIGIGADVVLYTPGA